MSLRWLVVPAVLCASACSQGADAESSCASLSAAVYNGSPDPAPLELSQQQRNAIVALESSAGVTVCTGTMVSARWILTASHCAATERIVARVGGQAIDSAGLVTHPLLDAMLVELEAVDKALDVGSVMLWQSAVGDDWLGLPATLAGFGTTENGVMGKLFFVQEPIVDVEPNEIWVDGEGKTGACAGDSGGPLLVADGSGQPRIAGVLDRGSANCLGVDVYTRVDVLADWIQRTTSAPGGGDAAACR